MRATTLSEPWRRGLLAAHIAASVSVLGADLVLLLLGTAGLGGAAPVSIYPAARMIAATLVAPLAVVALATGVALALGTPWRLFRYWWVTIKLAITVLLTAAVLFVLLPALGETAAAVTAPAPAAPTLRERVPLAAAPAVASALLVVAVVLGVFKPPWRTSTSSRRSGPSDGRGVSTTIP